MKKLYIYFSLSLYIFLIMGFNNPILCSNLLENSCNKIDHVECNCCHLLNLADNLDDNCHCIKEKLPINNIVDQVTLAPSQYLTALEDLYNNYDLFNSSIVFRDKTYTKDQYKSYATPNKNLAILRTIVLLI